jgi:hypothetical protein
MNFVRFLSKIGQKMAKILRGVTQLNFDREAELNFNRKKNWMLTDAQLDFDKKKEKKDAFMEHSTAANPPPKAYARKAQRRRVCGSATVP